MFGYSNLFRSRWRALIWATGVLFTAYMFAASGSDTSTETNQPADSVSTY